MTLKFIQPWICVDKKYNHELNYIENDCIIINIKVINSEIN